MSSKDTVIEAVKGLPEETSFDDIVEHLATLAAIRRGEQAADAGQVISHEDLKKEVRRGF